MYCMLLTLELGESSPVWHILTTERQMSRMTAKHIQPILQCVALTAFGGGFEEEVYGFGWGGMSVSES